MDFPQTYETTIYDAVTDTGVTIFVVPSRSVRPGLLDGRSRDPLGSVSHDLGCDLVKRVPYIDVKEVATLLTFERAIGPESIDFANYITNARIVPFESSPLGAESLSSIGTAAHKVGSVGIGTYIGVIAAGSHGAFLLVTVPLGIAICGLSVSLARWLEENRKRIWERLIFPSVPATGPWTGPEAPLYGERGSIGTVESPPKRPIGRRSKK